MPVIPRLAAPAARSWLTPPCQSTTVPNTSKKHARITTSTPERWMAAHVGAEVAGDHERVGAHLRRGALGDHDARLEAVDAVAHRITNGMSCSMSRTAAPSSRWISRMSGANASVSRCDEARGRLVEQEHPRTERDLARELDHAARPGRQRRHRLVGGVAEPERREDVVGLGALHPFRAGRRRQGSIDGSDASGPAPSSATITVSRTVRSS